LPFDFDNGDLVAWRMIVDTMLRITPKVSGEVLPGVSKRRDWGTEEKLRILAQASAPGSSPVLTCCMHGISSGQFYTWRKQFRSGALTGFVPVSVAPDTPAALDPANESSFSANFWVFSLEREEYPDAHEAIFKGADSVCLKAG
jgi:transposase-like protein